MVLRTADARRPRHTVFATCTWERAPYYGALIPLMSEPVATTVKWFPPPWAQHKRLETPTAVQPSTLHRVPTVFWVRGDQKRIEETTLPPPRASSATYSNPNKENQHQEHTLWRKQTPRLAARLGQSTTEQFLSGNRFRFRFRWEYADCLKTIGALSSPASPSPPATGAFFSFKIKESSNLSVCL